MDGFSATWILGHLYVRPEYQGAGIGSALLAWAKKRRVKSQDVV
jgi:GNAT superfamily N-acetyltransferase